MARHRKPLKLTDRWAFWSYDLFPHMLGSTISTERQHSSKNPDWVWLPAYMSFVKPFAIVEGLAGAKLQADLEQMREDLREETRQLNVTYRAKLIARLEEAGVHHPRINPLPEPA